MKKVTHGQCASPGIGAGNICFTSDDVIERSKNGGYVIFVKKYTTQEDTIAIMAAKGVITEVGGVTSHASVCAREFNIPCVINCLGMQIDEKAKHLYINGVLYKDKADIIVNANTGDISMKGGNE